jgi:small GTP-binding protein
VRDQDDGSKVFKAVLIGDGAVGKTSIRRNYLGEEFIEGHIATIGVDLATKKIVFQEDLIKFIIWDLAGQPTFEKVRGHYYKGSTGIILVYAVDDRESFDNASKWLVEAYKNMGKLPPTIIVGNKIDLRPAYGATDSFVTKREGQEFTDLFIDKLDIPATFIETSARTGENVKVAFHHLLSMMSEVHEKTSKGLF